MDKSNKQRSHLKANIHKRANRMIYSTDGTVITYIPRSVYLHPSFVLIFSTLSREKEVQFFNRPEAQDTGVSRSLFLLRPPFLPYFRVAPRRLVHRKISQLLNPLNVSRECTVQYRKLTVGTIRLISFRFILFRVFLVKIVGLSR